MNISFVEIVYIVELTLDFAANQYCLSVCRRESESLPPEMHTRIRSPSWIILNSSIAFKTTQYNNSLSTKIEGSSVLAVNLSQEYLSGWFVDVLWWTVKFHDLLFLPLAFSQLFSIGITLFSHTVNSSTFLLWPALP